MNVIVAGHWLLSCWFLMWEEIMEQDQAKRYLKEYIVEKGGSETTDSHLIPLLYYWLSVVMVDPPRHKLHLWPYTYSESSPSCSVIHIAEQVWNQARTIVKFVCLSHSYPALKQTTTNFSHFHSFKSSSASAGPNINCCTHLHRAAFSSCSGDTYQTVFVHSSGPTVYVPFSLLDCGTQCRVRGARTLFSGCNHDEVCCTHHSSAVMNSADHRKAMASSH